MSQRVKIRLSGARVIPRNAISLDVDWSRDFAVIEDLLLSVEKLPQNVQEDSGVLITLLDGDSSDLTERIGSRKCWRESGKCRFLHTSIERRS